MPTGSAFATKICIYNCLWLNLMSWRTSITSSLTALLVDNLFLNTYLRYPHITNYTTSRPPLRYRWFFLSSGCTNNTPTNNETKWRVSGFAMITLWWTTSSNMATEYLTVPIWIYLQCCSIFCVPNAVHLYVECRLQKYHIGWQLTPLLHFGRKCRSNRRPLLLRYIRNVE